MQPGCVISWKDFGFYDGGGSNKLIIILNEQRNGTFLGVRTTSQPHDTRPPQQGCQHQLSYYYLPEKSCWFRKNTWVLLYEPYELDAEQLQRAHEKGSAKPITVLEGNLTRALINCFKRTEDCSQYHIWLLS